MSKHTLITVGILLLLLLLAIWIVNSGNEEPVAVDTSIPSYSSRSTASSALRSTTSSGATRLSSTLSEASGTDKAKIRPVHQNAKEKMIVDEGTEDNFDYDFTGGSYTPTKKKVSAQINYNGKTYQLNIPKIEAAKKDENLSLKLKKGDVSIEIPWNQISDIDPNERLRIDITPGSNDGKSSASIHIENKPTKFKPPRPSQGDLPNFAY